jgi:transcriptional regulator with XRE-family HTH domain
MTTEQRHETAQLTPGTILKTAREQRGMSQQDVAHRLNLRISLIRDIEEDRFDQKTASTFTRGYLKTYARFVGTDDVFHLAIERFHVFLAWLDQELSFVLAEIPSQKVEAVIYICSSRFFF